MNVVDSSGWLEFVSDGKNAEFFAPAIENPTRLIVPTISLFEVFRVVARQRGESSALKVFALMSEGRVVDLDPTLALAAARLSVSERLSLADSVMLATARSFQATFWTQDSDFEGRPGVRYVAT